MRHLLPILAVFFSAAPSWAADTSTAPYASVAPTSVAFGSLQRAGAALIVRYRVDRLDPDAPGGLLEERGSFVTTPNVAREPRIRVRFADGSTHVFARVTREQESLLETMARYGGIFAMCNAAWATPNDDAQPFCAQMQPRLASLVPFHPFP